MNDFDGAKSIAAGAAAGERPAAVAGRALANFH
jgi:hypothetical protein